ncbi:MAG TPA: DUF4012 domain-containing protein [Candidatus Andersenbacteria bacterium]|nr:DUF4012 domain-containing protein [Candidatus Andersenbacteria bacterium]
MLDIIPPPRSRKQGSALPLAGERDVPYHFLGGGGSISLPRARRGSVVLLLVFCFAAWGVVAQLRAVAAGAHALGPLKEWTTEALNDFVLASSALAETDFVASETNFLSAEEALHEARTQYDQLLGPTRLIAQYLDVTGTVRSGRELLAAGEHLTQAGQHLTAGLAPLFEAEGEVLPAVAAAQAELTEAAVALREADEALRAVDSVLLPSEVVAAVAALQEHVPQARAALEAWLGKSEIILALLGNDRDRQYLILFQNNHELRPTGGFIGSLALIEVDRGKMEQVAVRSVYDLDGQLNEFIAPPEPLRPITARWYLRDANWFVDWPASAASAAKFFEREGGGTVDGVIALTPDVVEALLAITGPIPMPAYDVTVSADNFRVVTQEHVTYNYDRTANDPKKFLAELAPLVLERLKTVPAVDAKRIVQLVLQLIEQKSLLLYFHDAAAQASLREQGWSGELPAEAQGFLAVNNANIGGHKSDQFMDQQIEADYEVLASGDVDVVLKISRTHHGPTEGAGMTFLPEENPAVKNNVVWQRVVVPAGAVLLDSHGGVPAERIPVYVTGEEASLVVDSDVAAWQGTQRQHPSGTTIGSESGYTFFANWLTTAPGETSTITYHYRLPGHARMPRLWDPAENFSVYLFKQPGDERTKAHVRIMLPSGTRVVHTVPAQAKESAAGELTFASELKRDMLAGVVFALE